MADVRKEKEETESGLKEDSAEETDIDDGFGETKEIDLTAEQRKH